MGDGHTIVESGRTSSLAFEHRFQDGRRLPDLPCAAGNFEQRFEHRPLGASLERDLHEGRFQQTQHGKLWVKFGRTLRTFDLDEFRRVVTANLLFKPLSDFGRVKLPLTLGLPPGQVAPLDQPLDLPSVAPQPQGKLLQVEHLVVHWGELSVVSFGRRFVWYDTQRQLAPLYWQPRRQAISTLKSWRKQPHSVVFLTTDN